MLASCRAVGLTEALEHVRHKLGLDPLPGVRHADLDSRIRLVQPDVDTAFWWRKLDRVAQKVPQHLLQALGITPDRANRPFSTEDHLDSLRGCGWSHDIYSRLDYRGKIDFLAIQAKLSGNDARSIH